MKNKKFSLVKSNKAFQEAQKYLPGGVNSPVRSFKDVGGTPPMIEKGKGSRLFDLDGNKYLDFCASWGPLILGHTNHSVTNAVWKSVKCGSSFGACHKNETTLARMVVAAVPSIEQVRFVNSGTEAVMSAIRLARAFTKRKKIVKFDGCYHGHADCLLVSAGSGMATASMSFSAGVPEEFIRETISIPFNDLNAFKRVVEEYRNDIAVVIVEPVPANMGVVLPNPGFLSELRAITRTYGILLIFDEVITGFRLAYGGAQEYFGITPDITCLGKIIGGGFPVGAYGSSTELMSMLAPLGPVYQAGTLSGNPIAMAAGIATLKALQKKGFYEELGQKTAYFIASLKEIIKGKEIQINSIGSMFTMFFSSRSVSNFQDAKKCDTARFADFYQAALSRGLYFSPSQFEANFISTVHSEQELNKAVRIIGSIINSVG
ncbi:MAG: glutamate-1-semialdehyde-2,1-aminomutase [Candidatus Margulisiibacteriota bacterium]|nr:MAG: glutamate-1-semialdehyde-2,1-aminomutase [Candidatus Margulisbacteria bacterium GWD2_39_127]OGI05267.1 MAG: glutamate-1-semialdehyde-2,1-aminomutase [Candidatus Margulisbacteria bacterium GWF2_38_17]OGI10874.1 MAG: glutamate-1-semialdehyde-2,1-aminomutase [Candidatus Margulisbacteria bacterium GWE2_39_32]PZM83562.1 MAG: glutamate-1-semialdehyde-2,1-aminomutase [Candidatus Margulisiibacteriota bacterium]HAR64260.1 glutamate-1-semialdehyde-2,1-aminomutase [Candidatus Margulisiibacteriota 